jgi:hypothetical protein
MKRKRLSYFLPGGLCEFCKHFQYKRSEASYYVCAAFPDGIPYEIAAAQFDHRKPHPDDNGTRFELTEGEELPARIEELYLEVQRPRLSAAEAYKRALEDRQKKRDDESDTEMQEKQGAAHPDSET